MNKKIKSLIDKAKDGIGKSLRVVRENKKVQVSIVAGLTAVIVASGVTYYVLNNKDTGKKEIVSSDTVKEDEIKSDDLILAEDENGNLVVKDQEGNVVAEGDEVAKVVEEKKSEGKNIVAQTSDGSIVKPTPKPPVIADNNNNTNKPSSGTDKPSTDNSGGNSSNNNSNNNSNNSGNNKPSNGNNGNSNNGGSTSKPQEPSKPTQPEKPVEPETKPEVKPEPPKRTWTYMADMSRETFNLMNKFRQDNGVAPLKWSNSEHTRAKKQAESNASKGDGGHDFGQISLITKRSTSQGFIDLWKNSASHKEAMLDSFDIEGAVAVYKDSDGVYYVVASFNDGW